MDDGAAGQWHAAGARARRASGDILSEAEAKERAAPEKKKVWMAAARERAMREARGEVLGVMDRLAYHLAKVVGSWCGRLAGQEEERAGRGAAHGPAGAARRAVAEADGPTPCACAHQGRHPRARADEAVGGGGGQCAL